MRSMSIAAGALVMLMITSCGGGPTEKEINNSLENTLQSVAGDWTGSSSAPNAIHVDFKLVEGANGQVSGTGTMKEDNAPSAVPITVTGTFQRPMLTLVFDGMVYESHPVKGAVQDSYTSVAGVWMKVTLTAPDSREILILLHEK